ncbi:MAG: DUF4382 domain-containing protein [Gammaproteobacteria bacterium]|nr:DUF4382 domain-containing protein [Gammaproteobacteria bacterium]
MNNKPKAQLIGIATLSMLLSACGTDSSGSGSFSLDITDAPIDSAAKVVVSFSGVSIKPESGSAYDIDFVDINGDPILKTIDLLSQQGPDSEPLLVNHTLDAGHYNWLRLKVVASQTTTDSYIELDGGAQHPLYVPSGNETGLKLNRGFDITDGGAVSFTIDFDLRKSVLPPNNHSPAYKLKPTLRIVENDNIGHIAGSVGSVTLNDVNCIPNTNYAIYVFTGNNVSPDDIDGIDAEPVTTALLSNTFEYAVGFLDEGAYTLAFTCQADEDTNETDDVINFIGTNTVTVTSGTTTTYNFN